MPRRDEAWVRELWRSQDRHEGDHERLFRSVARAVDATRVLYPGSYVDIAASFVFDDVTYVDIDDRAAAFFAHTSTVDDIISSHRTDEAGWRFVHADYTAPLPWEPESFDLLISLSAGPVSDACGHLVRIGGHVLVNPSHGDVELLRHDAAFTLAGVITARDGEYVLRATELDTYLRPRREPPPTRQETLARGRGVAYTRSASAYLFERIG